ncbi:MAG: ABC transporter ATP-binding protein [Spirochaetales bacterium]|nr:ABC transporter ATP-binding protein [Spirochaetales bacterium]
MIRISGVNKKYQDIKALDHVDLEIGKGELFGLLGPNGAGKTSLIKILCGLLSVNSGDIFINGLDLRKDITSIKRIIGIVPQDLAIYKDLTAYENIRFFASLYGLKGKALKAAVEETLEFTGLSDSARKKPKTFSGGMKRRLNIACGLAHSPKILFMDEPTVGIDPQTRNHILESVRQLNRKGCTVIYTTHYMEEAESLCSRIAIIDHGKIIAQGSREELQSLIKDYNRFVVTMKQSYSIVIDTLRKIQGVLRVEQQGPRVLIDNDLGIDNLEQIISYFTESGFKLHDFRMEAPNLEMVFLTLTGRKLRD